MEIRQKISLDFARNATPITVFAKQNDNKTRFLEITPLNSGQSYTLEEGITPRLQLTKADGHTVFNDATIENGVIIAELTAQALAAPGVAVAEIGLYKGEELLSSQTFYIDVERAAFDKDAPASSDEFKALINALGKIDGATTAAAQATEDAEKVNISTVQTETGVIVRVTDREGNETTIHINGTVTAVSSWEDIRNAVRLGLGESLFPVGYEFTTEDFSSGTVITWVVRAHNHHPATNKKLTYTMTLEAKHIYNTVAFDAAEAIYYVAKELSAGTYNFTWRLTTGAMVSGTYQFTLTKAVPAGGQIVLGTNSNTTEITKCQIATYADIASTTPIQNGVTVKKGSDGTNLGTITATSSTNKNLNCAERILWGSNNYAQSAIRQWLNNAANAGSVYTPTNVFDRRPDWAANLGGFMLNLPAEFLAAVQPAAITCRTNGYFEINSLDGAEFEPNQVYTLNDKFFLLSRPEIYGTYDNTGYKDGMLLEFYEGLTNTERIKYKATGSAYYSWLRSPNAGNTYVQRVVFPSGALNGDRATSACGVAPACIIA